MFDKRKSICIALPTCEPEELYKYWLPTVHHLKSAQEYLTIAINFQPPYTVQEAESIVSQLRQDGFNTEYCFNSYNIRLRNRGEVPINRIRYDAASLCPDAFIYCSTDDDLKYGGYTDAVKCTAGDQFLWCLDFMLTNDKCGFISTRSSLTKKPPKYKISYILPYDEWYMNGRGFFLRNMHDFGLLTPNDSLSLVGGFEDMLGAASRMYDLGLYPAKVSNFKAIFHSKNLDEDTYGWHNESILNNNIIGYIKDNYNERFSLKRAKKLVDGPDVLGEDYINSENSTIDYSGLDISVLKDRIDRKLEEKFG